MLSRTITSGGASRTMLRHSSPEVALATSQPSGSKMARSRFPTETSSSTTSRRTRPRLRGLAQVASTTVCRPSPKCRPPLESATMKVGALEIHPVHDGWARMPAGDLLRFTGGRDEPWLPHGEFINADGTIELSLGGFLVRTGDRVVLVDAGAGRISNEVYHGGQLLESLAALGLGPEDVTDVVFTHLHFDHVGWATQKG